MKLCKYVMYACKYIVKNNVLAMKTEDEEDAFMKPTYYRSSESKVDHHSFNETINRTPFCKRVSSLAGHLY